MALVGLLLGFLIAGSIALAQPSGSGWVPLFDENWDRNWQEVPFHKNAAKAGNLGKKVFRFENGIVEVQDIKHLPGHLFYVGPYQNAKFRKYEVKLEVFLGKGANGGLYFNTAKGVYGWPKQGCEIKFNNTHRQFDKTGSIHRRERVKISIVPDEQWFELHLIVDETTITSKINGKELAELRGSNGDKCLQSGTFALQKHTSRIRFRNMRIKVTDDS